MLKKRGILYLIGNTPSLNAAEYSRFHYIQKELLKNNIDTYIMTKQSDNKNLLDKVIQIRSIINQPKLKFLNSIIYRLHTYIYTFILLFNHKFNFVIIRDYDTAILIPFFSLFKIKIYYDFHGLYELELINRRKIEAFIATYCEKILLKHSNKIIAISNGIINQIRPYYPKCIILTNGVDINKILQCKKAYNNKHKNTIIGYIGNWESFMRIEDLCKASHHLENATFMIVGKGYNYNSLINKFKNNKKIIFTGRLGQEQTYSILNRCDICVLPYDKKDPHSQFYDFFSSRKAKEYLAAGKPIIASNVKGKEHWLIENQTCLLYESGDIEDMVRKINMLINDKTLYEKISMNNYKLSLSFSWTNIIKKSGLIEDLYQ